MAANSASTKPPPNHGNIENGHHHRRGRRLHSSSNFKCTSSNDKNQGRIATTSTTTTRATSPPIMMKNHTTVATTSSTTSGSRCKSNNVWLGRILFCSSLFGMAILLGCLAYYVLTESEIDLAERQFYSIAERALHSSSEITLRKRMASVTMSQMISIEFPNANVSWPNVYLKGFEQIANSLLEVCNGKNMAFAPMVYPQDLAAFEEFAYERFEDKYGVDIRPSSNTTGSTVTNRTSDNIITKGEDGRRNGSDVEQAEIIVPYLQHSMGVRGPLLQNVHVHSAGGHAIDDIIQCSKQRYESKNYTTECGVITDVTLRKNGEEPSAFIMEPVYPTEDKDVVSTTS